LISESDWTIRKTEGTFNYKSLKIEQVEKHQELTKIQIVT